MRKAGLKDWVGCRKVNREHWQVMRIARNGTEENRIFMRWGPLDQSSDGLILGPNQGHCQSCHLNEGHHSAESHQHSS